MDAKLEQLMGRGKEAAGALKDDDDLRKEGKVDQFSADVKQHTRRWTDNAQQKVDQAIDHALALGCPRVNCLTGRVPEGASAADARRTLVDNLRFAAPRLRAAGIGLLVEPVNHFDIPGFALTTTAQALALMDEVGSPDLRLQYDIYHAQRMEGELGATLSAHIGRIGHIQLADNPGRGEPGTGEINFPWLLRHIDALGYDGWIGCEYRPRGDTAAGLGWRKTWGEPVLPIRRKVPVLE